MSKRTTKYEQILGEARERAQNAQGKVQELEADLTAAKAAFNAHYEALAHLERALTPTPRKASTKKQASAPAQLPDQEAKGGLCSYRLTGGNTCLATADNALHDKSMGYAGYHPFVPSTSVARAPRKSKPKSESTPSIQSIEGEMENAMSASSGGD